MKNKIYHTIVKESFKDIDLSNRFFNSFKKHYLEFEDWFKKKQDADEKAFVINTPHGGIVAFGYFKSEKEDIILEDDIILPAEDRLKIGSLKVDTRMVGKHLYHTFLEKYVFEIAKSINVESIYVTTGPFNFTLIEILEQHGFTNMGYDLRGDQVYLKKVSKSILPPSGWAGDPSTWRAHMDFFPEIWKDNRLA